MAVEGHYAAWTLTAGEDLDDFMPVTGSLFRAIALDDGKIAQNGREAGGILLYGGKISEHVTLGYAGVLKFVAMQPCPAGAHLTVDESGGFRPAVEGEYVVGRCLDHAVGKDSVGMGAFNFSNSTPM